MTSHATAKLTTLPVGGRDHIRGPASASATLLEYADFECPACGQAYGVLAELEALMPEQLCFAFRNFPLTNLHPHAQHAAEAAEAAAAQGRFWDMHDCLFMNQEALEDSDLLEYAAALQLDVEQFARDMTEHRYARRVREDFMSGARSGVNGTPTLFINGERYDGPRDVRSLMVAINEAHVH